MFPIYRVEYGDRTNIVVVMNENNVLNSRYISHPVTNKSFHYLQNFFLFFSIDKKKKMICFQIGVVSAFINTNLKLEPLSHSIRIAKSRSIITTKSLLPSWLLHLSLAGIDYLSPPVSFQTSLLNASKFLFSF